MPTPLRFAARTTAVAVPVAASLFAGSAAFADTPTTWADGGDGLSGLDVLLIFVGIPLALFIAIGLWGAFTGRHPSQADITLALHERELAQQQLAEAQEQPSLEATTRPGGGASGTW